MRIRTVLAASIIASTVPVSPSFAEGINLSWNDCGTYGTLLQTFDCASNSGVPFTAVASFVPPAGVDHFLGISSQIDIHTSQPALPDWWKHGTSECRSTSGMSVGFDFTGMGNCWDFFAGQAAGGSAYDVGFGSPSHARLRVQAAVPFDNRGPVFTHIEYYAYKVNLLRAKSTGSGSCAGCGTAMCLVLSYVQLFQPPDAGFDPLITNPYNRNWIEWQQHITTCPPTVVVPNRTWGQVKSLFR